MNKIISSFLLLLIFTSGVWAQGFPTTGLLDDFSGTLSNWTNGVTGTGTCSITSGVLNGASGTDDCYYSASSFGADQEVYVSFPNVNTHVSATNLRICMCLQDNIGTATVDGYCIKYRKLDGADNDIVEIEKMQNAGFTGLGTAHSTANFSDGDQVGMSITSIGTITLYHRPGGTGSWSQVDQITNETTFTCANTYLGIILPHNTFDADNFSGGTISSGSNNLLMAPAIFFN